MSSGRKAAVAAAIALAVAGPASAGSEPSSSMRRDERVAAPTPPGSPTRTVAEVAPASSGVAEKNGKPKPVSCIAFWGEARYVVGYNHIVHIYNGCAYDAVCSVRTDVNPTPQTVAAPQKQETQVVTFLGSPVGRFVPFVDCVASP